MAISPKVAELINTKGKYSQGRAKEQLRGMLRRGQLNSEEKEYVQQYTRNPSEARRRYNASNAIALKENETLVTGGSVLMVRTNEPSEPESTRTPVYTPKPIVFTGSDEDWRKYSGQQTQQEKAGQAAEQLNIRQTLPNTARFVPYDRQISIEVKNENRNSGLSRVGGDRSVSPGELEKEKVRQERITNLLGREQRLEQTRMQVVSTFRLDKKPDEENVNLLNLGKTNLGIIKTAAQLPIDVIFSAPKIGGRVGFAVDSATYKEGRMELGRAALQTPKEVVKSFDIRTTGGITNIALTAFAVKGIATSRKLARTEPEVTLTRSATQRTITPEVTTDLTKFEVKSSIGKKVISKEGQAETQFLKVSDDFYEFKGTGKVGDKPFELRGAGKTEEGVGTTSTTRLDIGKKKYLGVTQTQEVITEPTQLFRSVSMTQEIRGKSMKPVDFSVGTTQEMIGRNVLTESGESLGTQQLLRTNNAGISAEQFGKQFKNTKADLSRTFTERKAFDTVYQEPLSQGTVLKMKQTIAPQEQLVIQAAKQDVLSAAGKAKTGMVLKNIGKSATSLTSVSRTDQKARQQSRLSLKQDKVMIRPRLSLSAGKAETKLSLNPKSIYSTSSVVSKPMQSTRPIISAKPSVKPSFAVASIPVVVSAFAFKTSTSTPVTPKAPPPPDMPLLLPPLPTLSLGRGRGSRGREGKQRKKYTPSLIGIGENIRGKTKGILTGAEIRGI